MYLHTPLQCSNIRDDNPPGHEGRGGGSFARYGIMEHGVLYKNLYQLDNWLHIRYKCEHSLAVLERFFTTILRI